MKKLSADDWSDYWAEGSITTFKHTFHGNYDGEIAEFWHACFSTLTSQAKIVDLACGNGALALLAEKYAKERNLNLDIHAVDFAQIHSKYIESLDSKMTFHPNCSIEQTPFESHSVDFAMSQYGFEYADLEKACDEVHRVLKPAGAFCFIAHSLDSVLIEDARQSLEAIRTCIASPLLEFARALLEQKSTLASDTGMNQTDKNRLLKPLREQLNTEAARLMNLANTLKSQHIYVFVKRLSEVFTGKNDIVYSNAYDSLNGLEREFLSASNRMEDMMAAALDQDSIELIRSKLTQFGFDMIVSDTFFYDGKVLGTKFQFKRRV